VRAWFDWKAERQAAKRRVVWSISLAGYAFRGWLRIIDRKRRRIFLDWALGPNLSVLSGQMSSIGEEIRNELDEETGKLRDEVGGHTRKLRQEMAVERKAVRELLNGKMDAEGSEAQRGELHATRQELAAVREQVASQAERQLAYSMDTERETSALHEQLGELSREVEERAAQANRDGALRAGRDEVAFGHLHEQLAHVQRSKANHEELMTLISKLQSRPKPGQPLGVTQLLTVPYPLPPSQPITSSPRSKERLRPSSATARAGQRSVHGSALREIPTVFYSGEGEAPKTMPEVLTSEQILLRSLPADAEPSPHAAQITTTRIGLVPPSSHTPALSARAAATAAARRPQSARRPSPGHDGKRDPTLPVALFDQRTSRMERSLGSRSGAERGVERSALERGAEREPAKPELA